MIVHETTFVNMTVYAVDMAFPSVLPHGDVPAVHKYWLTSRILCYHDFIVVQLVLEIRVVEIRPCIDEGLLFIGLLDKDEKLEDAVGELL